MTSPTTWCATTSLRRWPRRPPAFESRVSAPSQCFQTFWLSSITTPSSPWRYRVASCCPRCCRPEEDKRMSPASTQRWLEVVAEIATPWRWSRVETPPMVCGVWIRLQSVSIRWMRRWLQGVWRVPPTPDCMRHNPWGTSPPHCLQLQECSRANLWAHLRPSVSLVLLSWVTYFGYRLSPPAKHHQHSIRFRLLFLRVGHRVGRVFVWPLIISGCCGRKLAEINWGWDDSSKIDGMQVWHLMGKMWTSKNWPPLIAKHRRL